MAIHVTNTGGTAVSIYDDAISPPREDFMHVSPAWGMCVSVSRDIDGDPDKDVISILNDRGNVVCTGVAASYAEPSDTDPDVLVGLIKQVLYPGAS